MTIRLAKLTAKDLGAVDGLMKRNSNWVGFLPREALLDYLAKGGVYGAICGEGTLVGYLLYGQNPSQFRITQLCVSKAFRGQGIAKRLVDRLKESATSQKAINLKCRRDFPADKMWPKLGFTPISERSGKSAAGHLLTHWWLPLVPNEQLSLFQERLQDDSLDVIIDSQILFDLDEPESDKTRPSKALASDAMTDSVNLWITDEVLVEINRNEDSIQRIVSRQRAQDHLVEHDPRFVDYFEKALSELLPTDSPSRLSDVRHISKAAATDIRIFVTRDETLLGKSAEITGLTNIQVLSPTELIIRLHELTAKQSYLSSPVSGITLEWRRLSSEDINDDLFSLFHLLGERKGHFRERLHSYLVNPEQFECEQLWSKGEAVALRVSTIHPNKMLSVPFARVAPSSNRSLFERYLIASSIYKAVEENLELVRFDDSSIPPSLRSEFLATGFTECNDCLLRFCFSRSTERSDALSVIRSLSPNSVDLYQSMPDTLLERHCSPLCLATEQKYFLIPIRPGYAMSLFDSHQSARGLFGGKISVLLRWENVYYRKKTHHKILVPPARILWYVSGNKQIVAVSHLDEVEIGNPKALLRKFKKLGILDWQELYKMCGYNAEEELMALIFSHTFPFRNPISLEKYRSICEKDGVKISLQSPAQIPIQTFQKVFLAGYQV